MTATVESLASIVYQRDRREAVRLADEFPNGLGRRVTTCRNDLAHPNERWDGKNGIKKTKQEIIELCELVMQLPV